MSKTSLGIVAGGALSLVVMVIFVFIGIASEQKEQETGTGQGGLKTKEVPKEYVAWVTKSGQQCQEISAPVIAAQIEAESNWNPDAESGVGAKGLSQFMPDTWPNWGRDDDGNGKASPYDPGDAIMAQGRYDCALAKQVRPYAKGDDNILDLTLAAYNAGVGRVQDAGGVPQIVETQQYVKRIRSLIGKYTDAAAEPSSGFGKRVVDAAKKYEGTPYSWGGGTVNGPSTGIGQGANTNGFDCSGLVQYAVYQASHGRISLPRTADLQAAKGEEIPRKEIKPGDVIAFSLEGTAEYDHIGIYVGGERMIHAPTTGDVVKISGINTSYYNSVPQKVRRFG